MDLADWSDPGSTPFLGPALPWGCPPTGLPCPILPVSCLLSTSKAPVLAKPSQGRDNRADTGSSVGPQAVAGSPNDSLPLLVGQHCCQHQPSSSWAGTDVPYKQRASGHGRVKLIPSIIFSMDDTRSTWTVIKCCIHPFMKCQIQ